MCVAVQHHKTWSRLITKELEQFMIKLIKTPHLCKWHHCSVLILWIEPLLFTGDISIFPLGSWIKKPFLFQQDQYHKPNNWYQSLGIFILTFNITELWGTLLINRKVACYIKTVFRLLWKIKQWNVLSRLISVTSALVEPFLPLINQGFPLKEGQGLSCKA